MKYVRDQVVVGDVTVFVGTQLMFKEESQHYATVIADDKDSIPGAVVVGINSSGILWECQTKKNGVIKGKYTVALFAKEFHAFCNPYNEKEQIAMLELFEKFGGDFHGPNIETACIPLHRLFALAQHLNLYAHLKTL